MSNSYKVISLFAGIGGICRAFKNVGAKVIWANEIDKYACQTYQLNMPDTNLIKGDICNIDETTLPNFDILTAGFPCQSFSIAGYQTGFNDDRGNLFFETLRFINAKKPRAFLLENVKNLVSHDHGKTFKIIMESLRNSGYLIKYRVMNSMHYGNIPQNRERIYIIGFRSKSDFEKFVFPSPITLRCNVIDIIDIYDRKEDKFYYTQSSKFHDLLINSVLKEHVIYQLRRTYVRENKSGVCPTLTANMGTGGNNVPIIKDSFGIRKFTPLECFKFQGFSDIIIPKGMSNSQLYKQAGNSVTVPVVERLAMNIIDTLDGNNLNNYVHDMYPAQKGGTQLSFDCLLETVKQNNQYTCSA